MFVIQSLINAYILIKTTIRNDIITPLYQSITKQSNIISNYGGHMFRVGSLPKVKWKGNFFSLGVSNENKMVEAKWWPRVIG